MKRKLKKMSVKWVSYRKILSFIFSSIWCIIPSELTALYGNIETPKREACTQRFRPPEPVNRQLVASAPYFQRFPLGDKSPWDSLEK